MNEEAKNMLAQARVQSDFGRAGEAVTLLQRALILAPDDSTLLCYLATAYHQEKQWDKMLHCAEKAISASPNYDWPRRIHSIALRNLKRKVEGLAAAREAVRCSPDSPVTLNCLVHALMHCGKLDEARQVALRMIQVAPENAASHVALARVSRLQWQWAEVEQCARRALHIDAENTYALDLLAESLSFRRQTKESLAYSALILRLNPTHNKAQERLHAAFQVPFCAGLTVFAPMFWLGFYAALAPALAPYIAHRWITGLVAFCCALCFTMILNALIFKFCPLVFLLPQSTFRQQPPAIREHVVQDCKREWLACKWAVFAALLFLLALAAIGFAPYLACKRLCKIKPLSRRRAEEPDAVV